MKNTKLAVAAMTLAALGVAAAAEDAPLVAFNIEPKPIGRALADLGEQAGLQILVRADDVRARRVMGSSVTGQLTVQAALDRVLAQSGLTYDFLDEHTVRVRAADAEDIEPGGRENTLREENSRSSNDTDQSPNAPPGSSGAGSNARTGLILGSETLQEILVTAQRRTQRALDVPTALQVYSGAELDRRGADKFQDYVLDVPGLSFRQQGSGSQRIAIRGVSNIAGGEYVVGDPASTVGLYLDDIALSSTAIMPDVSLYDLNRVEVMKGPQGTLYGEGAMGGAIKMALNEPDLTAWLASADVTFSSTRHGGFNGEGRAMVNIPLATDRVGLRLVGSYKNEDGFVDNVFDGTSRQNGSNAWSGRALLKAQITDRFTLEALALRDDQHQDEFPQVELTRGDLKIGVYEPRFSDSTVSVAGLTLGYDAGFATLASISSFFQLDRTFNDTVPFMSYYFPGFGISTGPDGLYTQESFVAGTVTDSFAQELRLVSKGDQRLDWVVGAFYRDKEIDARSFVPIPAAALGAINATLLAGGFASFPSDRSYERHVQDQYEHKALYGEITFEITAGLDVIAGLRWFDETIEDVDRGFGFGPVSYFTSPPTPHANAADGVVPKFGLKYTLGDDVLLYAQAAKGFRSPLYNIQSVYGVGDEGAAPDKLWSYEVGFKSLWAGGAVSLDASAYYIDWRDIQLTIVGFSPVTQTNVGFIENGGTAEVRGAEVVLSARPVDQLRFGFTAGYTDGEIVEGTLDVQSGEPLPNAPEWTLGLNAEYRVPIGSLEGYIRFDAQYVDEQATKAITAIGGVVTNDGEFLPSFILGNLRLGVEADNRWGAVLFIDNLWDERARLGRGITSPNPTYNPDRYTIARPRTIGVSFRRAFQ